MLKKEHKNVGDKQGTNEYLYFESTPFKQCNFEMPIDVHQQRKTKTLDTVNPCN
jgi:hypothetical protein